VHENEDANTAIPAAEDLKPFCHAQRTTPAESVNRVVENDSSTPAVAELNWRPGITREALEEASEATAEEKSIVLLCPLRSTLLQLFPVVVRPDRRTAVEPC
jgi:hypothetical protein